MWLKIFSVVLSVAVLPVLLETTTGCKYNPPVALPPASSNSYECGCVCSPEPSRHRMQRVDRNEDDSEEQLTGTILLNSPDLDFQNGRFVGLKFRDVQIPANATIDSADVQFVAALASNAGTLTVQVDAELLPNGGSFGTSPGDLSGRTTTANPVSWNLNAAWAAGSVQTTPSFASALQQIVNLPGWIPGNDVVVLFEGTAGATIRKAFSFDGQPTAAPLLTVEYEDPVNPNIGPLTLQVCMLPEDNANLNGGVDPTDTKLAQDCAGRVATTVSGLASACGYPPLCNCDTTGARKFADKCDADCIADPVNPDCSDFNPPAGNVTATNAGTDPAVCVANSPLSSAMYGQRTTCAVDGFAFIEVEGELKIPAAEGIVKIVGEPCPGSSCAVGLEYNIDVDPIKFGNFLKSATFSDLASVGESTPGNEALLSPVGFGTFSPAAFDVSAQGSRGSDKRGLATTNDDDVDLVVFWGNGSFQICSVRGTLVGAVGPELKRCENAGPTANMDCDDDSQCTDDPGCSDGDCNCEDVPDSSIEFRLDVSGPLLNQPPVADAGLDQEIECVNGAVNNVVLDGSGSSDLDSNIVLYSWLKGSRVGQEVGFDPMSKIEQQSVGAETYILRVIDASGEADEDSVEVAVVDTIAPVVSCSVTVPIINQTNHNLINVGLAGTAVDSCEGDLPITVNVFADENDEEDTGDGKHSPDAKDLALGSLRLRAERKGTGDGRVYLIIAEATDSSGNRGSSCCTVAVPRANTQSAQTAVAAQAAAARTFCEDNDGMAPVGYFTIGDGPPLGPKQ